MSLKLPRNWDFSTFKAETARIARSRSVTPGEGGPSPGSPHSPRSMERPLKAGWLKKQQRSLVKNWQQRYFVLRGSTLTYHKDDKETTVQGVIQLRFSKVNELPPNSDDPGKYLFEIIPRTMGDRERCPYVLMANSQSDMEEVWVRTLRRVIGVPTSGVFGKSLMDTITYEQRFGPHLVPILVQKCVEFIKEHGLNEEGIFRLPGQDNAVKQFRDAFDAGERPSFPSDTDVHTVASLLKLYLRELPEPVVPWTQYQDFLDCTNLLDSSSTEGWEKLEKQIALLPRVNYNLLSYVCRFLFEVQLQSKVNKMNVENLATVMGINLLKPQIEDPITVMKATPQIQKLMTVMIRQHEDLFPLSKDVLPSPPLNKAESQKNIPRSFVGWESAEMGDASLSESPEEEEDNDSPGPLRGNSSPKNMHQEPCSPSTDDWLGSPRKRTQTLPTFNCPLTGMAAKADALSRWSHIQESFEEKSGTLSEDIFKILDLRSSGSLFRGPQIGNKEGEDRLTARRGSDNTVSSTADSQKSDSDFQPAQVLTRQKSAGNLTASGSVQQVNSRSEQKTDSQQSVNSLQQENRDLKATVAELKSALEAERRRVAAVEICLRNAERSRDEAQRRNEELQRDIQQFLTKTPQAPT
ncbi:rho GTPase-activating protein 25 [Plectropomus leopardus]|uniref:rho GTPase-activating protein 25 n=1 Tax=Plectropomus leopardus TaxID=160734 RepID=UPI001C4AC31E|nr:rho GTPase-activating protein 25 [Plectropomus leopardus]XP_042344712.1 rho GTPase-activating protein 25 [Plectropomus leopardus]